MIQGNRNWERIRRTEKIVEDWRTSVKEVEKKGHEDLEEEAVVGEDKGSRGTRSERVREQKGEY